MRILLLLGLVLSVCFPAHLYGETGQFPGRPSALLCAGAASESEGGERALPSIFGLPGVNLGKVVLNPYVQVGYQKVGTNITFPIGAEVVLPAPANTLQIGNMELLLQDASFWTGTVGLNAVLNPTVSLFSAAGGFAPKEIIAPSILPISVGTVVLPSEIIFTGNKVEYWFIQAGAAFGIGGPWSVLAGYLWDHFAMAAVDPRIGSFPFPNQTLRADFLTTTGVPFLGLQLSDTQLKYKASIIYSPLAQAKLLMASRNTSGTLSQLLYSFNKPGQFVAVNGEFDVELSKSLYMSFWGTGSWMKVKGNGSLEFTRAFPAPVSLERTRSGASVEKYSIGGGLGLGLIF